MTATNPVSLRELGRRLSVSANAVSKAVKCGRLSKSVGRDAQGRPFIADVPLALTEWTANVTKVTARAAASAGVVADLAQGQWLLAEQRTRKLRLENDLKEREMLPATAVAHRAFEAMRMLRDTFLALPPRLSPTLAAESDAGKIHRLLDAELRHALNNAAANLEGIA